MQYVRPIFWGVAFWLADYWTGEKNFGIAFPAFMLGWMFCGREEETQTKAADNLAAPGIRGSSTARAE